MIVVVVRRPSLCKPMTDRVREGTSTFERGSYDANGVECGIEREDYDAIGVERGSDQLVTAASRGVPIRILPNARRKHRKRSADLLSSQTVVYPPPEYLG